MQVVDDHVVLNRGSAPQRLIPLSDIAGVDVTGGWVRILRMTNSDYSYAHEPSKDKNAVRYRDTQMAHAIAAEVRAAANVLPGASRPDAVRTHTHRTERLSTLDGAIVIDLDDRTIHLGADGGPLTNATALVEAAGAIRTRLTATRIAAVGILALAWRKKVDERELYLTVDGSTFQFVARIEPQRGAEARQFAARISTLGKR